MKNNHKSVSLNRKLKKKWSRLIGKLCSLKWEYDRIIKDLTDDNVDGERAHIGITGWIHGSVSYKSLTDREAGIQ